MADGPEPEAPPELKRQKLMSKEETEALRKEYIALVSKLCKPVDKSFNVEVGVYEEHHIALFM